MPLHITPRQHPIRSATPELIQMKVIHYQNIALVQTTSVYALLPCTLHRCGTGDFTKKNTDHYDVVCDVRNLRIGELYAHKNHAFFNVNSCELKVFSLVFQISTLISE